MFTENIVMCIIICFTIICIVGTFCRVVQTDIQKEIEKHKMYHKMLVTMKNKGATQAELSAFSSVMLKYVLEEDENDG